MPVRVDYSGGSTTLSGVNITLGNGQQIFLFSYNVLGTATNVNVGLQGGDSLLVYDW